MLEMLQDVKYKVCPHCGCMEVISEKKESPHVSGRWNEYRKFRCDFEFYFCPNFDTVSENRDCTWSDGFKEKEIKRREAHIKLEKYIKRLDVDKKYQKKLLDDIHSYSYSSGE